MRQTRRKVRAPRGSGSWGVGHGEAVGRGEGYGREWGPGSCWPSLCPSALVSHVPGMVLPLALSPAPFADGLLQVGPPTLSCPASSGRCSPSKPPLQLGTRQQRSEKLTRSSECLGQCGMTLPQRTVTTQRPSRGPRGTWASAASTPPTVSSLSSFSMVSSQLEASHPLLPTPGAARPAGWPCSPGE